MSKKPVQPKIGRPLKFKKPAVCVSVRLDPDHITKIIKHFGTTSAGLEKLVKDFIDQIKRPA